MRFGGAVLCFFMSLQVAGAASAYGFCYEPQPVRLCTEFAHSDEVLTAQVMSIRPIADNEDHDSVGGWLYRLKVLSALKGERRQTEDYYSSNDSGRFPLERGQQYLLLMRRDEKHRLVVDSCGHSGELGKAGPALRQIEDIRRNLKPDSVSDIYGRVSNGTGPGPGVAGIPVKAVSGELRYIGVTNLDGRFDIKVPRGSYVVTPDDTAWKVEPYELSYDDPNHTKLEAGGCADLQFLVSPSP